MAESKGPVSACHAARASVRARKEKTSAGEALQDADETGRKSGPSW